MHIDAIEEGWNVLIHDDLLATGGTAAATAQLIKMQKAKVAGFAFLIALNALDGRKNLKPFSHAKKKHEPSPPNQNHGNRFKTRK